MKIVSKVILSGACVATGCSEAPAASDSLARGATTTTGSVATSTGSGGAGTATTGAAGSGGSRDDASATGAGGVISNSDAGDDRGATYDAPSDVIEERTPTKPPFDWTMRGILACIS